MVSVAKPFRYEAEMLACIERELPKVLALKYRQSCSIPELYVDGIIPDLVFFSYERMPELPVQKRLSCSGAWVLTALREQVESTSDELAAQLFATSNQISQHLSSLQRVGLIERTSEGRFRLTTSADITNCEIVAVEFKMKNWREALAQGCNYLSFANRAYVILDGNQVQNSPELRTAFRKANVGLILQRGWQLYLTIDSRDHSPLSPYRYIAVQKMMLSFSC